MRLLSLSRKSSRLARAFSLIEVLVAMAIIGILFVALYAGFLSGFQIIHVARENLRATQIMVEKMETIRLYTWDQINGSNGFVIPTSFTAYYYPGSGTNVNANTLTYYGTLSIAAAPNDTSYSTNMKTVTVSLLWTNSNVRRSRQMTTFVSRYGLQNYIY